MKLKPVTTLAFTATVYLLALFAKYNLAAADIHAPTATDLSSSNIFDSTFIGTGLSVTYTSSVSNGLGSSRNFVGQFRIRKYFTITWDTENFPSVFNMDPGQVAWKDEFDHEFEFTSPGSGQNPIGSLWWNYGIVE
jgi:hypothetical protein